MLVLSRKKNESIVINNDITVTVVEIRGDKVRLGIVAPKEVPVHRQEVYDAIHGKGGESADPDLTVRPIALFHLQLMRKTGAVQPAGGVQP